MALDSQDHVVMKFKQSHKITEPFSVQDRYELGGFTGKLLLRQRAEGQNKKKKAADKQDAGQGGEGDGAQEGAGKLMDLVLADQVRRLHARKEHFGVENFINVFNCFYLLSNVPRDAQNHPLALYMDAASAQRGFHAAFGVECEEVAIRFYHLFVEP